MSGAAIIIIQAAIQRAKREREEQERELEKQKEIESKRGQDMFCRKGVPREEGMYCRNCTQRIDGEMRMKVENDHIAFYHPGCFPEDPKSPVSEETQKAIAKSLIALAKLLGGYSE